MESKQDLIKDDLVSKSDISVEVEVRGEWIEPRLERRGDLSSSTGFFGGFSP